MPHDPVRSRGVSNKKVSLADGACLPGHMHGDGLQAIGILETITCCAALHCNTLQAAHGKRSRKFPQ